MKHSYLFHVGLVAFYSFSSIAGEIKPLAPDQIQLCQYTEENQTVRFPDGKNIFLELGDLAFFANPFSVYNEAEPTEDFKKCRGQNAKPTRSQKQCRENLQQLILQNADGIKHMDERRQEIIKASKDLNISWLGVSYCRRDWNALDQAMREDQNISGSRAMCRGLNLWRTEAKQDFQMNPEMTEGYAVLQALGSDGLRDGAIYAKCSNRELDRKFDHSKIEPLQSCDFDTAEFDNSILDEIDQARGIIRDGFAAIEAKANMPADQAKVEQLQQEYFNKFNGMFLDLSNRKFTSGQFAEKAALFPGQEKAVLEYLTLIDGHHKRNDAEGARLAQNALNTRNSGNGIISAPVQFREGLIKSLTATCNAMLGNQKFPRGTPVPAPVGSPAVQ